MRLDVRSIVKAAAWGMLLVVAGGLLFAFVSIPHLEAIFNVAIGVAIGVLFGWITVRCGGLDGFSPMAVGGCLAAIVPVAMAWAATSAIGGPGSGALEFALNPGGMVSGAVLGAAAGVIGALIYASRF